MLYYSSFILTLFVILLVRLFFIIKKEIIRDNEIKEALERQKQNTHVINEHAQEVENIKKDKLKKDTELDNVETEEEVLDAVNNIMGINNSRVRKQ